MREDVRAIGYRSVRQSTPSPEPIRVGTDQRGKYIFDTGPDDQFQQGQSDPGADTASIGGIPAQIQFISRVHPVQNHKSRPRGPTTSRGGKPAQTQFRIWIDPVQNYTSWTQGKLRPPEAESLKK